MLKIYVFMEDHLVESLEEWIVATAGHSFDVFTLSPRPVNILIKGLVSNSKVTLTSLCPTSSFPTPDYPVPSRGKIGVNNEILQGVDLGF